MSGNLLEGLTGPVTQSVEAVKNLLAFVGRASDPLPSDVSLDNGRLVLVLNNKKDAFYTCTATKCSCLAHTWHPGQRCKHQRRYFPQDVAKNVPSSEPLVKRGDFKPFDLLPGEARAAKA